MRLTRRQTHATFLGGLYALLGLRLAGAGAVPMVAAFDFAIAGGWHHGLKQALKAGLQSGAMLTLRREPENPHDGNAIAVHGPDGTRLGYVPLHANEDLAEAMDEGMAVKVEIVGFADTDAFDEENDLPEDLVFTSVAQGDPILRLWVEDEAE